MLNKRLLARSVATKLPLHEQPNMQRPERQRLVPPSRSQPATTWHAPLELPRRDEMAGNAHARAMIEEIRDAFAAVASIHDEALMHARQRAMRRNMNAIYGPIRVQRIVEIVINPVVEQRRDDDEHQSYGAQRRIPPAA